MAFLAIVCAALAVLLVYLERQRLVSEVTKLRSLVNTIAKTGTEALKARETSTRVKISFEVDKVIAAAKADAARLHEDAQKVVAAVEEELKKVL